MGPNGTVYEDVYILTIPIFRWIKINVTGNTESTLSGTHVGGSSHTCETYQDRQMAVLGGELSFNNETQNNKACNASYPAIRVLDISNFTWLKRFSPEYEPYGVPDDVLKYIDGRSVDREKISSFCTLLIQISTSGNALVTSPSNGFSNSSLAPIFSERVPRYQGGVVNEVDHTPSSMVTTQTSTPPTSSPSPSFSPSPSSSPRSKFSLPSKDIGAIAGGIGAVE